ncbi:MAG: ketoacyl-ACP synthase III [Actinobacteria bacterium]|jgi:3-oxoacyl-[acyl-carrier-protein] synthase-3|nr:ketoacyl-ACP synthase III [Actinomycetota bacterium]
MGKIKDLVPQRHSRIYGVGGYRPERVVTNAEVCARIDSTDEWIRERSGIESRRWAGDHESVVDMAENAARKALAHAGISMDQIDAVIVATVTYPYQTPSAATELIRRLENPKAAAFDISAACAGFCYGVGMASDFVRGGSADYVLLVGVEKLTDFIDLDDRAGGFLFADGAGAVVIGPSDVPGIGPTVWGSDADNRDAILQKTSWLSFKKNTVHERKDFLWPDIQMVGQTVFRWAVWQMVPVANKALELAGLKANELDAFIPHQANMRIIDAMVKALDLPAELPVARDIRVSGNTSAASIPLAMEAMLESGEIPHGGSALLIGFGAGLVYAAQVVTLP